MREIVSKYENECQKCGATLPVGARVVYERRVGIYCLGCAPTDPEEIRTVRTAAAERRAEKYEEWAGKRHEKAQELYNRDEHLRKDWAFTTQPGHIPERARMIRRTDKAFEHEREARRMEAKANSLRSSVRVAGDAEARREASRERTRTWIAPGVRVNDAIYGLATVLRVNRLTATIQTDRGFKVRTELSFLERVVD